MCNDNDTIIPCVYYTYAYKKEKYFKTQTENNITDYHIS